MTHITYVPSVMDKLHRIEASHQLRMLAVNATFDNAERSAFGFYVAFISVVTLVFSLVV